MSIPAYADWDPKLVPQTPAYIVNTAALEANCRLLNQVQERTGAKILLALKGYAMFSTFPIVSRYLSGTTASGLHEALLGYECFGGETHVYCAAYKEAEIRHLVRFAHSLVFNSPGQWKRFRPLVEAAGRSIDCGLRVNPGYSEVGVEIYNPCAAGSRLGTPAEILKEEDLDGLNGLHFHALCEQGADVLERTLKVFEEKCGKFCHGMKWVNFGGGHHITRPGYDIDLLCRLIDDFQQKYQVQVYLEPGEAIGILTGVLVVEVVDVFENHGVKIAILDTSATCHMPDVLEMPYRPEIVGADLPGKLPHTYRLGGLSCLAGDVIGDYSFAEPLEIGQRLVFLDMAHYTMVKNTTFNGVPLPAIGTYDPVANKVNIVRKFGYSDYRDRLS